MESREFYINLKCDHCENDIHQEIDIKTYHRKAPSYKEPILNLIEYDFFKQNNYIHCQRCNNTIYQNIYFDIGMNILPKQHEDKYIDEWIQQFFNITKINIFNIDNPLYPYIHLLKKVTNNKESDLWKTIISIKDDYEYNLMSIIKKEINLTLSTKEK